MALTPREREFLIKLRDEGVTKDDALKRLGSARANIRERLQEKETPEQRESLGERVGTQLKKGLGELTAPIRGAAKRAVQLPLQGSELVQKGLKAVTDPITGNDQEVGKLSEAEILQRKGTGEKIGSFVTDVAATALPLGGATKAAKGASLATKALTQAAPAAAVGAVQASTPEAGIKDVATQAAVSGGLAGAFPVAGTALKKSLGTLFGRSKLIQSATGLTKTVSSKSDDIAKTPIKIKGVTQKAYDSVDDFLVDEGFFRQGVQTTRADMLQHADDLFSQATASKKELLKKIKTTVPVDKVPRFTPLVNKLLGTYDELGLEKELSRIKQIASKSKLTAIDLDDLRKFADDLLPRGAFSGAEPVKAKGLENTIAPLRSFIASLDETGTIQKDNIRKRILSQMLGIGKQTNPLKIAVEKDPGFNIARDLVIGGAGAGSAALIPGGQAVAPFIAAGGIAKAITENPSIASGLVNVLGKFSGKSITPEVIQNIIKAAGIEGASSVASE